MGHKNDNNAGHLHKLGLNVCEAILLSPTIFKTSIFHIFNVLETSYVEVSYFRDVRYIQSMPFISRLPKNNTFRYRQIYNMIIFEFKHP